MFEKVRKIIAEQLGIEEDEITMESSFIDDLGADSLDIVELIMAWKKSSISKFLTARPKRLRR